jgi:hypothetical protein
MVKAFLLGMYEFRRCITWADPARTDRCNYTKLDEVYDQGREWAHRLTFRKWDV